MTTITREVEIQASKEEVWNMISNYGEVYKRIPAVKSSHLTSELTKGVGTTRRCDMAKMGGILDERIIEWDEGNSYTLEVFNFIHMPGIKMLHASFNIKEEDKKVILEGTLSYEMKNAFFDAVDYLVLENMHKNMWDGIMAGQKKYLETGEEITLESDIPLNEVRSVA